MHQPEDQRHLILSRYNTGTSCSTLAREYGVRYQRIWKLLKAAGATFQRTKLSKAMEAAMLADYQSGLASAELGVRYGIAQASVCNYVRRAGLEAHAKWRRAKTINESFFKTLTPESVWLLGWFYSDGNVATKSNGFSITVHSQDEGFLLNAQRVMGSDVDSIYRPEGRRIMAFYGCEPTIHDDLISLGCVPNKSLIIRYPTALVHDWQHWAFLRGVLEGDGHVGFKAGGNKPGINCEFASGSLGFLQDIAALLKSRLDINTKIVERANSNSKRLIILGGKEPILRFLDLLYADCPDSLRLERKYQTYLAMREVAARERLPAFNHPEVQLDCYFMSPDSIIYHVQGIKPFARTINVPAAHFYRLSQPCRTAPKPSKWGWKRVTSDQIEAARSAGTINETFS